MTDFKAGDKIRYKNQDADETDLTVSRTIDYVGKKHVVYTMTRESGVEKEFAYSLDNLHMRFELVPEVFEVGKEYIHAVPNHPGPTFIIRYADNDVALGHHLVVGRDISYVTIEQDRRKYYKEV